MLRPIVIVGLAVALLAALGRAEDGFVRLTPADADLAARSQDWYGVYVGGKKVGWYHQDFGRIGAGSEAAYVSSSSMYLAVEAQGQQVEMQIDERKEFDAAAPFALRAARSETKETGGSRLVEVRRESGAYKASVVEGGESRAMDVAALDYTLADSLTPDLWIKAGRAAGDTARFREFDVSELKADAVTYTVSAVKESLVAGVRTKFYEATLKWAGKGVEASATLDTAGKSISSGVGGLCEIRAEPEEQARRLEKSGDLFVFGTARIDRPIGDPRHVTKLVVDVEGAGLDKIVAGPRQSVERSALGGTVTLSLGAGHGETETATAGEMADALAETVDLPTKLPKVVELATEAVGDAKTTQEKVDRLVHFVSGYVEDAAMPRHVPVTEILTAKKGDCTEHALLFVTLARAAGIPARLVGGLMYMGDDVKAFGGHKWGEVVVDGKWVPVDPTWDQTVPDATHIALTRNETGMGQLATLGRVKFKLKDVATSAPAAPAAPSAPAK